MFSSLGSVLRRLQTWTTATAGTTGRSSTLELEPPSTSMMGGSYSRREHQSSEQTAEDQDQDPFLPAGEEDDNGNIEIFTIESGEENSGFGEENSVFEEDISESQNMDPSSSQNIYTLVDTNSHVVTLSCFPQLFSLDEEGSSGGGPGQDSSSYVQSEFDVFLQDFQPSESDCVIEPESSPAPPPATPGPVPLKRRRKAAGGKENVEAGSESAPASKRKYVKRSDKEKSIGDAVKKRKFTYTHTRAPPKGSSAAAAEGSTTEVLDLTEIGSEINIGYNARTQFDYNYTKCLELLHLASITYRPVDPQNNHHYATPTLEQVRRFEAEIGYKTLSDEFMMLLPEWRRKEMQDEFKQRTTKAKVKRKLGAV